MNQKFEWLTAVETAKWLRKALRKAFPGVKFRVNGSRGTGYGYYDVRWTGGPSYDEVKEITRGFEGTHFGTDEHGNQDIEFSVPTFLGVAEDGRPVRSGMRGIALQRDVPEEEIEANVAILRAEWGFTGPEHNLRNAAEMMARGSEVPRALQYYPLTKETNQVTTKENDDA